MTEMNDLDRLEYLLAHYDRLLQAHELVPLETAEARELHRWALAPFREVAERTRRHIQGVRLTERLPASEVARLVDGWEERLTQPAQADDQVHLRARLTELQERCEP